MSLTSLRSSQTLDERGPRRGRSRPSSSGSARPAPTSPRTSSSSHVYLQHGFALWTNYWYAGRYTFVGYSLIYYPLAALAGIRLLAVISAAASTAAFTLVVRQTWGDVERLGRRGSSRSSPPPRSITAAFPYGLGLALRADRARRDRPPPARLVLAARAAHLRREPARVPLPARSCSPPPRVARTRREIAKPARDRGADLRARLLVLTRLFPDPGRYPFPASELVAALAFCALGAALTWRVESAQDPARPLHRLRRPSACSPTLSPRTSASNVVRLRLAAVPIAMLVLSLRRWRPLPVCVIAVLALAVDLERLAARLQLLEQHERPRRRARLLEAGDPLPAPLALARLPGRGGRHRRPLGGRLPAAGRDPDRARLVPPGRLPGERGALRQPQPQLLPRLASPAERALRRALDGAARLQRAGRGRACSRAAAPGCRSSSARPTSPSTASPRRCRS